MSEALLAPMLTNDSQVAGLYPLRVVFSELAFSSTMDAVKLLPVSTQ
jgi:hypothetical protein